MYQNTEHILKNIIFCLIALCSGVVVKGQIRSEVNAFLGIGFAADQKAHGNTGVALPSGSGAFWYNPSLGAQNDGHNIHYSHSALFANLAVFDVLSYSKKISDDLGIGIGFARLGVDDIQNTLALFDGEQNVDYSRISLFSASDQVLFLSANKKWKQYTIGVGAKVIYRKIGSFTQAFGLGFDVGISGKMKGFDVGAVLKDGTTTTSYWVMNFSDAEKQTLDFTGNEIPENGTESLLPHLELGISKKWTISDKFAARPILDLGIYPGIQRGNLIETSWLSLEPKIGGQVLYKEVFVLNMGIERFQRFKLSDGTTQSQVSPTLGVELRLKKFRIQYGLSTIGNDSDLLNNVFGIGLTF
ncbi:MAG: hypothetical protein ACJAY8_001250 [Sphingobacteriales bacterium]|jgi:hypothetical protein